MLSNINRSLFEEADGATLFLDDVCELSDALQVALVRFVQDRTLGVSEGEKVTDLWIVVAINRDLPSEVAVHRFREDLFYNLNIISLHVPALRERSSDILPVARQMLTTAAFRNYRRDLRIPDEVAATMTCYRWPGNVREMRNAMEAAAALCETDTITVEHLPEAFSKHTPRIASGPRSNLDEIERHHIARVLAYSTLEEAARRLGIDASTLWRKRKRYRLQAIVGSKILGQR